MDTKICVECGTSFDPRRATQRYCSPTCSRRRRDREWQKRNRAKSRRMLQSQLSDSAAASRKRFENAQKKCRRQQAAAEAKARQDLETLAAQHERETEKLRTRLRDLATINVDIACEIPELKAQVTELQLENARLLHSQGADIKELMQIAGRLFELSARLGLPLDKATREIFARRGWRTNTLVPDQ